MSSKLNRHKKGKEEEDKNGCFSGRQGSTDRTGVEEDSPSTTINVAHSRSVPECRICLQHIENQDQRLHPCDCSGSQAFVHRSCLSQWIAVQGLSRCNVCKAEYRGIPLRKTYKGIGRWLIENPFILLYCLSGCLVSVAISYMLMLGFLVYTSSEGRAPRLMRQALFLLVTIYSILFVVTIFSALCAGCVNFCKWRQTHYTVTMLPIAGVEIVATDVNQINNVRQERAVGMNSLLPTSISLLPKATNTTTANTTNAESN